MKNILERIKNKLGDIEECTGDLEDRIMDITQLEQQNEQEILFLFIYFHLKCIGV